MAMDAVWFIIHIVLNIAFYMVVVLVIIRASKYAYGFAYQVFGNTTVDAPPGVEIQLKIEKGAGTMDLAAVLETNRIIANRYSFYLKVKIMDYNIQAGTYVLNSSMTYDDILNTITNYANSLEAKEKPE